MRFSRSAEPESASAVFRIPGPNGLFGLAVVLFVVCSASPVRAQKNPELGYMFPPGGRAGTTVEVRLGGYDWTPDMDFFVLDGPIQLTPQGPPGDLLIPPPPYWFGARGRLSALPIPREVPAKLTIPPGTAPGVYHWQGANANGGTAAGLFVVGNGAEVVEAERRKEPQLLADLPVTVSGRLSRNEEVDEYLMTTATAGPISCELFARRLGSNFHGVLAVRDRTGHLVADAVDGAGEDLALTFRAEAATQYILSVRDIDHAGDRSFVYRLAIHAAPRVVTAIPAAGRRGETREVEFIGPGLATGSANFESVKRIVTIPADRSADSLSYPLETPFGKTAAYPLRITDLPESTDAPRTDGQPRPLAIPGAVTGKLDARCREHRYEFRALKGDAWTISLESRAIGGSLDVAVAVLGVDGKELMQNDDLPGTIDAGLVFSAPVDGAYVVVVADRAGKAASPDAVYRLEIQQPFPDFPLQSVQRVNVLLGGKFDFVVKATRVGGFKEPIALKIEGMPAGVSVPPDLVIPADKSELSIPLQAAADAVASASFVRVTGTSQVGGQTVQRVATFPTGTGNLSPRTPRENDVSTALVTTMMRPRCKGAPVDQDTVRKVHRGATFLADIDLVRLEGYAGEVTLKQAARQSYQVQGITGFDVTIAGGVTRAEFPCFMPEWLETNRTSRMGIVSVVQIPDASGRVRHLVGEITGFVTMSMEGALMKLSATAPELTAHPGGRISVPLKLSRSTKIPESARVELKLSEELAGLFAAPAVFVPYGQDDFELVISTDVDPRVLGEHELVIRSTVLQNGVLPVVSEAKVVVDVCAAKTK
jgi:hypothetical protein